MFKNWKARRKAKRKAKLLKEVEANKTRGEEMPPNGIDKKTYGNGTITYLPWTRRYKHPVYHSGYMPYISIPYYYKDVIPNECDTKEQAQAVIDSTIFKIEPA